MVTNFEASKLKSKMSQSNTYGSNYINYNNLLINTKVLNQESISNLTDLNEENNSTGLAKNNFDSEHDLEEFDETQSQITPENEHNKTDMDSDINFNNKEEDDEDLEQDDDENNNQINSISDYAEKLTEWSKQAHNLTLQAQIPMASVTSRRSSKPINFDEKILYDDVVQVNCNSILAELHKKKFGSGGKGRCIRVLVDSVESAEKNERWMTPIEFETFCGKGNCRDWKRTIKAGGQQILALLDAEILTCHAVSCSCAVCNQNESLVGPIKPFMRYRRRKKDEILAQNAYKKFLSLKPPTLLGTNCVDTVFSSLNTSNQTIVQNINTQSPVSSNASSFSSPACSKLSKSNDFAQKNPNTDDLLRFINKIQETEDKKWSVLENLANEMINQAKSLQSQIEFAKKEMELNRKVLIDKILCSNSPEQLLNGHNKRSSGLKRKLSSTQFNYQNNNANSVTKANSEEFNDQNSNYDEFDEEDDEEEDFFKEKNTN